MIVLGHIAGVPVEEWLLPWLAAGGALAGLRASFGRRAHRLGHAVGPKAGRPPEDIDPDAIDQARGKGLHP